MHRDDLPYSLGPRARGQAASAVRFRVTGADGAEVRGPVAWPRLCACARGRSHTTGCVRRPHEGSVRLRLPRLAGASEVVIERRSPGAQVRTADRGADGAQEGAPGAGDGGRPEAGDDDDAWVTLARFEVDA